MSVRTHTGLAEAAAESVDHTFAEWPTRAEWLAAADLEGLPRALADQEWANQERKAPDHRWRNIDRRRLRHHAKFVLDMARQRGQFGAAKKSPRPGPAVSPEAESAYLAEQAEALQRASGYPPEAAE